MSAATFTPGPWMYQATAGDHDYLVYPESTGRDVALVRDFNEANARLIAAAPDLLAALRAETRNHPPVRSGCCGVCGHYGTDCTAHATREAIAKAEGSAD